MPDNLSFSVLFGTSRESADIVSIAVNAVREGYAVIPVAPNSKKPLCTLPPMKRNKADREAAAAAREAGHRSWTNVRHECGFRHAITDEKEAQRVFRRLYEQHPDLNLALEVGRSRMLCVDADQADDVAAFTELWAHESNQPLLRHVQPTVTSPGKRHENGEWTHAGGGHFWFALPDDVDFTDAETSSALNLVGGAVVYFKDRVLLVPPSVREEGPYVLNSDIGTAPEWLVEAVRRHVDGTAERRKIQREKVHAEGDPIDVWSVDTPWSDLLEPDGWTDSHKFDACGCSIWSRPGDWSNFKSLTAHEPGCTRWDVNETGHGFAHVWTDEPPDYLRAYIDSTGSRSLSKLQYVAWRDHDGDMKAAMGDLALSSTVEPTDPWSLIPASERPDHEGGDATDPKEVGAEAPVDVEAVTEEQIEGLRARMYTASQLEAIPPPKWLIKGWLTTDALARLSGSPGSWKSFVALDMACCIATGIEYHGHRVKQGRVLYIAAEGVSGIRKRIQAWRLAHPGVKWVEENMIVLSGAVHAASSTAWAELCAVNQEDAYSMIILDTQARITAGMDENSNSEMSIFIARMDVLRQQAGTLVMAVHHTGHEGKRGRGASSMWGAMDIDMFLDRKKADDDQEDHATLSFIKSKESSEDETLVFKSTEHPLGSDEDGEPVTSLSMRLAGERGPTRDTVAWWAEVLDNLGLPNDAGRPACREALKEAGYIGRVWKNDKKGVSDDVLDDVIEMRKKRDDAHKLLGEPDPEDSGESGEDNPGGDRRTA